MAGIMLPDPLRWIVKSKTGKIVGALYVLGMLVFLLPQGIIAVRHAVPSLREQYREAFTGIRPTKEPQPPTATQPLLTSDPAMQKKMADLEEQLASLRGTGSTARIDSLDAAMKDLRATIFADPARAMTLQRIDLEQKSLASRLDSLQSQMEWLFGISLTLALGVLATVVSVVKSSFEKKRPDHNTN
jgi:hypothetical protein